MNEETSLKADGAIEGPPLVEVAGPVASFLGTVGSCQTCRKAVAQAIGERPDVSLWFYLGWPGLCAHHRDGAKALG